MLTLNRGYRAWTSFAGAFVAVLLGVGIVALTALLYVSGTAQVPAGFANAAIVVQSPQSHSPAEQFPQTRPWSSVTATALADRLAGVPGIARAVPDRTFYAQLVPPAATAAQEAHGWSSAQLGFSRLVAGRAPAEPGQVVLDRALGFAPGTQVTILTATGPGPYTVSGVLDGPGLYLSDGEAERLAPGVRAIGLVGEPTSRLVAEVTDIVHGDGQVLTGAGRGALEPRGDATTRWIGSQVLAGMAALAAFVSVFVVASTFALNVNQRRRQLGLLRVVGATPRQVKRLLYFEALTVGVVAAAAGVVLGVLSAPMLAGVLVDAGFEPTSYQMRLRWWPIAAAFALGPVVAILGVAAAARRAGRIRPLETLREAAVESRPMSRVRWVLGGLFAAGGTAGVLGAAASNDTGDMATFSLLATMALVVAATVLAPAVVPAFVRLVTWPLVRTRGAVAMLVRQNALTAVRRTASTAAPVLLTVTFAVLVTGNVRTATAAYAAGRGASVLTGTVLAPDATPGLSDAAVASVSGAALLRTTVYIGDSAVAALGVDPVDFAAMSSRLAVVSGEVASLSGDGTVVLTQSAARDHGWRQGEVTSLVLADGATVSARVVAVVSDSSAAAGLLLDRTAVRAHDPSALTSVVYLSGVAPERSAVGARVVDVATYAAEADADEDRLVWLFTLLLVAVSAGYGSIAVASTLLMAAAARRRDFHVLRLSGASKRQVSFMVAAESAVVVAIGSVLGGAIAFIALLGGVAALREQVGAPVDVVVPWDTVAAVVFTCLALAVIAGVVPTRR